MSFKVYTYQAYIAYKLKYDVRRMWLLDVQNVIQISMLCLELLTYEYNNFKSNLCLVKS